MIRAVRKRGVDRLEIASGALVVAYCCTGGHGSFDPFQPFGDVGDLRRRADLDEAKGAVSDCVKEVLGDLGENCLLGVVKIRLHRVIPEQRPRLGGKRDGFFGIERCFAVAWRQRHQAD